MSTSVVRTAFAFLAAFAASVAAAQVVPAPVPPAAPAFPTVDQQIAAAVLALPAELRDGAKVMGYRTREKLEVLRAGTNGMTCLALFAIEKDFHVACYQDGMEKFMARGRELRAQGMRRDLVDSVRFKEVKRGAIPMPKQAMMYQLFGSDSSWDSATGKVTNAQELLVLYMPGATEATSGLSKKPSRTGPWIMYPGTPKAHMMLAGAMNP